MQCKGRQTLVFLGAPLAIVPALAFLPALAYLVITPVFRHSAAIAWLLFPLGTIAEFAGISLLVRSTVRRRFDLLSIFAFSILLVLMVIATYTGIFLAALAEAIGS